MSDGLHAIETPALYVNPDRDVAVLNYNARFVGSIFELINSNELADFVGLYLEDRQQRAGHVVEGTFDHTDKATYMATLKAVLMDDPTAFDHFSRSAILESIENLYSFYRGYLRIATMNVHDNDILAGQFMDIDNHFNDLVLRLYRTVEEKLQGHKNHVYRQVSAGSSAVALLQTLSWPVPEGYEALSKIRFINQLMLRPPMMIHTKSNKRAGTFQPTPTNPIHQFTGTRDDWYCYPAMIGESLIYIYFHRDYFASGIALANLFQMADRSQVEGQKPDMILLFGSPDDGTDPQGSHYFYDTTNQLYVGQVPYNDKTTYFGYMKKMCLTLHNLHMIAEHKLPIHGSMVRISFANGKQKSVVFFGDSGAGKSESIEALQEVADDQIINIETIFDDMGSFTLTEGHPGVYAQGTETGAFVRLDDLSSEVAFNNMDRGVYMNPEQKNARVIIPANTWSRVVAHHDIDMWVYANNYADAVGLHRFDDQAEAKATFISGKRRALGTTDEVGMSTTFFANPFGPVQEEAATRPIIDAVFDQLYADQTYVGEIFTHLGNDKSKDKLNESAIELLDVLMNS